MEIYFLLIFIVVLLDIILKPKEKIKNRKIYLMCCFIFFTAIAALRDISVGADTKQFCLAFSGIQNIPLSLALNNYRYEKGFIVLCKILGALFNNSQSLIIFTSIFIQYTVFKFIDNNSKNVALSILIYILLNSYFMFLSAMRQAIAISILMIGFDKFYKNNKKVKFIISILLAMLFHSSAIFFIIILFIPKHRIYERKMLLLTLGITVGAFIFPNKFFYFFTLNSKYSGYQELTFFNGSEYAGFLNFMVCLTELIFVYLFSRKNINKNGNICNFYLYILSINLILFSLSIHISIFIRLVVYLEIFNIIYMPNMIEELSIKDNKKIIIPIYVILIFVYWCITSIYRPEWYGVIPYKIFIK